MDVAARIAFDAVHLYARASVTSTASTSTSATTSASVSPSASGTASSDGRPPIYKVIGIVLAICSGLFIGVSFVLKKIGLLKANVKYNEEAGEGYGYLKNAYWWTGMTLMIIGEICNFVAYAFVDAIMVTPLGALSVVVTTILSAIFLKERLSFVGKVSCFLCIIGSVVIVLNAPEQSAVADIQQMQHYVIAPGFLSYAGVIILASLFIAFWVAPRYAKKSMLVYLSICSLVGGLSVVATQGLGSAIVAQISGKPQFNQWFLYVLFVFVIATLLTEIIYLNKALNLFNAAMVTPTYYVYFTSSTIVASAILFQGFSGTAISITTVVLGFLVICSGVVLLQLAKSSKDIPDTAVFNSDLDQVRTMAEQEEPEYEPRADTVRGGAAIVRALSKTRTKRQVKEAHRLHDELMEPIGENEQVQWDGLRRRTTLSEGSGSLSRKKTVHPPLGMTHFPGSDEVSEPDSEVHPGFFGRIGRKNTLSTSQRRKTGRSPVRMSSVNVDPVDRGPSSLDEHVYGLPASLQKPFDGARDEDTSYKSPYLTTRKHLQWSGDVEDHDRERVSSRGSSRAGPQPPPHVQGAARRAFSFQNVFHRHKADGESDAARPVSRGGNSFISRHTDPNPADVTEEERLGLVQGDSSKNLPKYEEVPEFEEAEDSEDWHVTSPSGRGGAGGDLGKQRRRDPYDDDDDDDDLRGEPLKTPGDHDSGGKSAYL